MKRRWTQIFCVMMSFILFLLTAEPVLATTISGLQEDIKRNQSQLNSVNKEIAGYQDAQEGVEEEISDLDAEMVALLTDINLIQEAIDDKEEDIANTQVAYDAAVAEKDEQYESMKIRIKFMYEKGDESYLQLFLGAQSMSDMMNKAHYIEQLYEYDRTLLEQYEATVQQVAQLWDQLEEESELVTSKTEMEEQQAYVNEVLEQKKQEYENYSTVLAKAKREAAAYTAKIKQETAQIRKLEEEERKRREEEERRRKEEEERKRREEEERRRAEEAAAESQQGGGSENDDSSVSEERTEDSGEAESSGDSGSSGSDASSNNPVSSGGGKGQEIARFACQFIGNPYVAGGTSLTNGADCSGFVLAVYKNFGYSLPRSSYAQSGAGRAVSYAEAQPGDIIYYGGHVGIYIGNGQIVHASTERTGIKITSATYRSIITVRRIV